MRTHPDIGLVMAHLLQPTRFWLCSLVKHTQPETRKSKQVPITKPMSGCVRIAYSALDLTHRLDATGEVNMLDTTVGNLHQASKIHNLH